MTLRVGTRRSALATAQSGRIAELLGDARLVTFVSDGDRSTAPLETIGGTGVFVTALREALLAGEADVIVHSFKDLPTTPADGILIAAVPVRADPRDVLVARDGLTLATLPAGSVVGTGSPRRRAQVLASRPDLDVVGIRGNVDTRIARIEEDAGDRLDAVVLAAAGLDRLGRLHEATDLLDIVAWPTAPAQGALAIELRADAAPDVLARVGALDHVPTRLAAEAERGVLAALEAGCAAPLAAHAEVAGDQLRLTATVYALDGARRVTASASAEPSRAGAADLAIRVADLLLDQGAAQLAPIGGDR